MTPDPITFLVIYLGVIDALKPAAEKLGVPMPSPIANHKSQVTNG